MKKLLILVFWLGWFGSYAQVSGSIPVHLSEGKKKDAVIKFLTPPLQTNDVLSIKSNRL